MIKRVRYIVCFLLLATIGFSPCRIYGQEIDAKKIIFSHIGDSYGWHITTWGERKIGVPLPIIIIDHSNKLNLFLSSRIEEGSVYKNFKIADKMRGGQQ